MNQRDQRARLTLAAMPTVTGPACPACGSVDVEATRRAFYRCNGCQVKLSNLRVMDAKGGVYSTPKSLAESRRQCAEAKRLTGGGRIELAVMSGKGGAK